MRFAINERKTEPAFATPAQYKKARELLGLSLDKMPRYTDACSLPVDKNSVELIEAGEIPHPPTQSNSANEFDYKGVGQFYGEMDYKTRLHLFYQIKGIVFLSDDCVERVDPLDLWGHLAATKEDYVSESPIENTPTTIKTGPPFDVLRKLLKNIRPMR